MINVFKIKSPKVRCGDEVLVISGRYKGQKGVVKCVLTKKDELIIEGINVYKRATRLSQGNTENFVKHERPIRTSKVKVVRKVQKAFVKKNGARGKKES